MDRKHKAVYQTLPAWGLIILTAVFVALKLAGHIDWAWVWVFAPLWGIAAAGVLFVLAMTLCAAIFGREI